VVTAAQNTVLAGHNVHKLLRGMEAFMEDVLDVRVRLDHIDATAIGILPLPDLLCSAVLSACWSRCIFFVWAAALATATGILPLPALLCCIFSACWSRCIPVAVLLAGIIALSCCTGQLQRTGSSWLAVAARDKNASELQKLLEVVIVCAVKSPCKENAVHKIMVAAR